MEQELPSHLNIEMVGERNIKTVVSAIFVNSSAGGIFLDAGEGTLGQLFRKYGTKTEEVRRITCSFICENRRFSFGKSPIFSQKNEHVVILQFSLLFIFLIHVQAHLFTYFPIFSLNFSSLYLLFISVQIVSRVKVIWISHMHADHHLGAIRLLLLHRHLHDRSPRQEGYVPIVVIAPWFYESWLKEYSSNVEPLYYTLVNSATITSPDHSLRYCFIVVRLDNSIMGWNLRINLREGIYILFSFPLSSFGLTFSLSKFFTANFGFSQFFTVPVFHCSESYAVVMHHISGWKLVYVARFIDRADILEIRDLVRSLSWREKMPPWWCMRRHWKMECYRMQ